MLVAQNSSDSFLEPGTDPQNNVGIVFMKHVVQDQGAFWTAPFRLRARDTKWLVPLTATTAAFIGADSWLSKQVPPGRVNQSRRLSDVATYSLIGIGASSYLAGLARSDDRLREAGLLSGEAALNSLAVSALLQQSVRRQRPNQAGAISSRGTSFPSRHSAVAWSIASLWAHEYPGSMSQALAYGLASTVTLTRVTARLAARHGATRSTTRHANVPPIHATWLRRMFRSTDGCTALSIA
jgi:membrane-associated phospholipid phosphatase